MKIGILFLFYEPTARPGPFAAEMERLGFESLWVPEHPVLPVNPKTPFPQGGPIPEPYAHMSDQFVCLSMAAANTSRLKLGTGITLVPEHNPLVQTSALDTGSLSSSAVLTPSADIYSLAKTAYTIICGESPNAS